MANRQQTRILALRAGVRLHADCVITGQFYQPFGKLADHLVITFCLLWRAERMQFSEFRPSDRDHLGGSVQLHGARSQRDHCLVQGQIFALQRVHITHHLGFAVIAIKHRMAEDRIVTQHTVLNGTAVERHVFVQRFDVQTVAVSQQNIEQLHHVFTGGGFIERNTYRVMDIATQVDFCRFSTRQYRSLIGHFNTQSVKVVRMTQLQSFLLQTGCQNIGQTMDAISDAFQANRAMINGIQAGDVGQQNLRGTNVGVRFLAADMLFASLHRHAQGGITRCIFGDADNTAWHGAFEFVFSGKECRVRAAVAHRYAEALRRAENDIRALFARCSQQYQRHKVGSDADHYFTGFQLSHQGAVVVHFTGGANLLQQHAEHILMIQCFCRVINNDVKTKSLRTSTHYVQRLRMNISRHKETVGVFQFADAFGHRHGFSCSSSFIQQRSGSHVQAGQVQRHLLEVQQCFQTALGDFRLIRGVGGVPTRVFQHVTQDNRWQLHGGVAHANVGREALVTPGDGF